MTNFSLLQKRSEEVAARQEISSLFATDNDPWRQTKTFTKPNHPDNTSTSTGPTSWKEFKKRKQPMA